jgi:ABC-type amino acid transport substrate-binding protein
MVEKLGFKVALLSIIIWLPLRGGQTVHASGTQSYGPNAVLSGSNHPINLKVGVFERPPYTFKGERGNWSGIGIELWEQISKELSIPFEYVEIPLDQIYTALQQGRCDITPAVTLSTVHVDQTETFVISHGGVLGVRPTVIQHLKAVCTAIMKSGFFWVISVMLGIMLAYSAILMLMEYRCPHEHFSGPVHHRFFRCLWFTALSMTSIDYSTSLRLSPIARMSTFLWSMTGLLFISLLTGTIVSSISACEADSKIVQLDDLARFRTGDHTGAIMQSALRERGIPEKGYATDAEGIEALKRGEIEVFTGDAIPLNVLSNNLYPGKLNLSILPSKTMLYVMAAKPGLACFSAINQKLIEITLQPAWRARVERWTGPLPF